MELVTFTGQPARKRVACIGRRRLTKNHVLGFDSIDVSPASPEPLGGPEPPAAKLVSRETPLGGGLPVLLVGEGA